MTPFMVLIAATAMKQEAPMNQSDTTKYIDRLLGKPASNAEDVALRMAAQFLIKNYGRTKAVLSRLVIVGEDSLYYTITEKDPVQDSLSREGIMLKVAKDGISIEVVSGLR